jgi:hypothetical protein
MQPRASTGASPSVRWKPPWSGACAIVGAVLLGACVSSGGGGREVTVTHYAPSPIIVATGNAGVFRPADGCIVFVYGAGRRWRAAALFPPGTGVAADQRSLRLPNGQSIPFGREVAVVYEAPPARPDDPLCRLRTIQVLHLQTR